MICYDANVILEILFDRPKSDACSALIYKTDEKLATTMVSVSIIMYYAERNKADIRYTERFLRQFIWLPVTESDGEWAFQNYGVEDYEDGLQIACAIRENCKKFVTLDQALAKKYAQNIPISLIN